MKKATKNFTFVLLSSLGLLCAGSITAHAKQGKPNVFTGGTGATTNSVRIFQPTNNQPPVDKPDQDQPITLNKTVIIYNIRTFGYESRAQRRHRAFGHRYLGFIRQYSGNKYPF